MLIQFCIFTGCLTVFVLGVYHLRQLGNYKLPQIFSHLKNLKNFRFARKIKLKMFGNVILNMYLKNFLNT